MNGWFSNDFKSNKLLFSLRLHLKTANFIWRSLENVEITKKKKKKKKSFVFQLLLLLRLVCPTNKPTKSVIVTLFFAFTLTTETKLMRRWSLSGHRNRAKSKVMDVNVCWNRHCCFIFCLFQFQVASSVQRRWLFPTKLKKKMNRNIYANNKQIVSMTLNRPQFYFCSFNCWAW